MKSIPIIALAAVVLLGCAGGTQRPVLYPNAKFNQVGEATAQKDVDECNALAEKAGASGGTTGAARGGMQGAAMGAAASAVAGLIGGGHNMIEKTATGAAVGGAAGAAGGAFNPGDGGGALRNFVGRCMAERGYEVMGWK